MQYATWRMIQELNAAIRTARLTDLGYIPCPQCRDLTRPDATVCPSCGKDPATQRPSLRVTALVEAANVAGATSSNSRVQPHTSEKGKVA